MYYLDPLAIDRILDYDKDVKIILGVREPVDFAISLYGNMRIHGLELPSIIDVVQQFTWPLTPEEGLSFSLANDFLTNRVTELSDVFGDHLLLYDYNYFNQSPLPVLNAIEKFLKLKPHFNEDNFENLRINASGRRDPFRLNALFANQRVLDLLYAWLPKSTIRKLRSLYEELSVKGRKTEDKRTSGPNRVDDAERRELEDCFRGDRIYYENLFRDMPIRLGSGQGI
jgi:hypothetical protein